MYLSARTARLAGTKMSRTSSVRNIVKIKEKTGLPVIGLIKRVYSGFTLQTKHCTGEPNYQLVGIWSPRCPACHRQGLRAYAGANLRMLKISAWTVGAPSSAR